ncbi:hypothetical protein VTJ04DRAFT_2326 [Mycothermus thermophilus]|uniref:uncharacterized protein n=1 Tax=Humicola insolens TaxID=85995 RepID=UPI0037426877
MAGGLMACDKADHDFGQTKTPSLDRIRYSVKKKGTTFVVPYLPLFPPALNFPVTHPIHRPIHPIPHVACHVEEAFQLRYSQTFYPLTEPGPTATTTTATTTNWRLQKRSATLEENTSQRSEANPKEQTNNPATPARESFLVTHPSPPKLHLHGFNSISLFQKERKKFLVPMVPCVDETPQNPISSIHRSIHHQQQPITYTHHTAHQ